MQIPVDRLTESPSVFEFEAGEGWWRSLLAGQDLPGELPEPLHFEIRAHCMGADLFLEGSLRGHVVLECARCLARYRHPLSEKFRLLLEPAGTRLPADPEGAQALSRDGLCLGEEIDTGWFQGRQLDLGPFFHEIVALSLPVKPLCRKDCEGLCPRCGADRSRASCDCGEIEPESPFAVLRTLRAGRNEGDG
jgi:uncharacterized protein